MKTKILFSFALTILLAAVSGCVPTADGHMKGGMPLTKDRIVNRYERTVPQLVTAAREVLNRNGKIVEDNSVGNSFHAKINQRDVYVKMDEVDPKVTQVTVQARGSFGGDIDLASQLQTQIALQLSANP